MRSRALDDPIPSLDALRSSNPMALVSAVRWRLRRAGLDHEAIDDFCREVLALPGDEDRREACRRWVERSVETH